MNSKAYISGSLGQALFFQNKDAFIIDENSSGQPIICSSYNINLFLNHAGEIKKFISDALTIEKVNSLLAGETEKWEGLDLAIDAMNPVLDESERNECMKILCEYIESDELIFEFIENRLLGIPLAENLDVNLAIKFFEGKTKLVKIYCLYEKLFNSKEAISRIHKAFEFSVPDFIPDNKSRREFEILLVDKGIFKKFVDAIIKKSRNDFESVLIIFSNDEEIKKIIPNPALLFQKLENFIVNNWSDTFARKSKEPIIGQFAEREISQDPIIELINNSFKEEQKLKSVKRDKKSLRTKRKTADEVLEKVKSQIDKVEFFLFKNKLSETNKIIRQITQYQLQHSEPKHLIKTYSVIATKALKCYYFPLAEKMLDYSNILDNNDPVVHCINAEIFRKKGQPKEAMDTYDAVIRQFPNNVIAKNGRAETLRDLGKYKEALNAYDNIIREFPNDVYAKNGQAETLRDLGKLAEALNTYDAVIRKSPNNIYAKNGRTETLRDLGKLTEALNAYDNIIREFPNNVVAKNGRAETLRDLGKLTEALNAYDTVIREFPNNVIAKSGRAETLRGLGKLNEALNVYDNIIKESPYNSVAVSARLSLLLNLGKYDELKTHIQALQNPKTRHDWFDYHTLSMYYIKTRDYDTAIKRLKFGLKNCIWYVSKQYYKNALSFAYLQRNRFNESLELLLKDISKPVDHLLLTHAYAANNQKQAAKKHLQTIQNNEHPKIHLGVVRLSERYNLNGIEKTGKSTKELDKEIFEIEFDLVQSF